jgi:hypothetical protein
MLASIRCLKKSDHSKDKLVKQCVLCALGVWKDESRQMELQLTPGQGKELPEVLVMNAGDWVMHRAIVL